MADLQNAALRLRHFDQFAGLRGVFGDRLFDEQMLSATEQKLADLKV